MQLKYTTDDIPGFSRKKGWLGFVYLNEKGRKIWNRRTLTRIKKLGIPPAYSNVWICPWENGHIQATGLDTRGRKQYLHHPDWTAKQNDHKFHRLLAFASALSPIRRRISRDLTLSGMPKERVTAAIVKLLDTTYIRIGNEEYAKENNSFGLTTLQNRHVKGEGEHMKLVFKGKSGIKREVELEDKRLRKIIAICQDIPGQQLFEYFDEAREPHDIKSEDINAYLKEISEEDVTAKDFRTWHGTVIAAGYLWANPTPATKKEIQQHLKVAVQEAATALGNTPAICKKSYIHPQILKLYSKGRLHKEAPKANLKKRYPALLQDELCLVKLLKDL